MMIHNCCPSALLILSSRIGCYRFFGCICTAFSYSKWLPLQYQCTFNQKLHSRSFPPQLPSSSQGAAACRSSGFFCSYPRIDIPGASRTGATKTMATTMLLHFIGQMFIKFRHFLCQMFSYTFLQLTFPHKMATQLLHPFFICQMFLKRLFLPFLSPPLVRVLLHSSTTNFSSQNGHSALHSVLISILHLFKCS
jgi:hypothetical protein